MKRKNDSIRFMLDLINDGELEYRNGEFYRNGKLVKQWKHGKGKYLTIELSKDGIRRRCFSHRLIFALHHGLNELENHETIDHINGDKYDNRIENLQGLTVFENSIKDKTGKLTLEEAKYIRNRLSLGDSPTSLSREFNVCRSSIYDIKNRRTFKYI